MTPENATLGGAVAGVSELQTFLDTYPCQANANESCESFLPVGICLPLASLPSKTMVGLHDRRAELTSIFYPADYFFFEPFDEPVSYLHPLYLRYDR